MTESNSSAKSCPNCGRMNPSTATICDCRYDFETGIVAIVPKTDKPMIAGIMDILVGIFYFLAGFMLWSYYASCVHDKSSDEAKVVLLIAFLSGVLGVLAIIGGRYALKRKRWGWALIGSICAALGVLGIPAVGPICAAFGVLGIPAVILTALSKNEFE